MTIDPHTKEGLEEARRRARKRKAEAEKARERANENPNAEPSGKLTNPKAIDLHRDRKNDED